MRFKEFLKESEGKIDKKQIDLIKKLRDSDFDVNVLGFGKVLVVGSNEKEIKEFLKSNKLNDYKISKKGKNNVITVV